MLTPKHLTASLLVYLDKIRHLLLPTFVFCWLLHYWIANRIEIACLALRCHGAGRIKTLHGIWLPHATSDCFLQGALQLTWHESWHTHPASALLWGSSNTKAVYSILYEHTTYYMLHTGSYLVSVTPTCLSRPLSSCLFQDNEIQHTCFPIVQIDGACILSFRRRLSF